MSHDVQKRVMQLLDKGDDTDKASLWFDYFITFFILLNIAAVILESVPKIGAHYGVYFHQFERISILFFTLE